MRRQNDYYPFGMNFLRQEESIVDMGSFVQPGKLPDGNSFGERFSAFAEGIKNLFDLGGMYKSKPDSTLSQYSTWTLNKDGFFQKLDTAIYIKNSDSTGYKRFMKSVAEQRDLKIKDLRK